MFLKKFFGAKRRAVHPSMPTLVRAGDGRPQFSTYAWGLMPSNSHGKARQAMHGS
jgi:hypothetical protein